mgnify:CR=1 FL=1
MFIRLKMNNTDLIKNADRIDSIYKSVNHPPLSVEELEKGIEKTISTIKIKFTEEVNGKLGVEIAFDSEDARDKQFEEMSKVLDARLFDGK